MATAVNLPPPRPRARYENWRPPLYGVSLLIPVGTDALVITDLRGLISLPAGPVAPDQSPQEAAQHVLRGAPGDLPELRHVVLASAQMRRRKVITHVLATAPITPKTAAHLAYHDPRAEVRVWPTMTVIDNVASLTQVRVLVGLQVLAGVFQAEDGLPDRRLVSDAGLLRMCDTRSAQAICARPAAASR
ncbi:hypothetical protein [Streptomyces sp. MNP-20]|uniref:hypothetical protein n=1 Tax=Streptomyces sp. MNP-20 TaxID=2721165 RepID=UPI001556E95E|nr:hypothetical protein [Streptomyces sp. MNP-20]